MATVAERKIGEKQNGKEEEEAEFSLAGIIRRTSHAYFYYFLLIPSIFGVYISFTKWDLFSSPEFVGLENCATILFDAESSFSSQFGNGLALHLSLCFLLFRFVSLFRY